MNESTVCFVNSSSSSECILVSDAQSAAILKRLLSQIENEKWVIKTELDQNLNDQQEEFQYITKMPSIQAKETKMRVLLICGTSTFRSTVSEISSEMMALKTTAPQKFDQKECLAYVSCNQMRENVELPCKVITEWNGVSRLELINPKESDLEKLAEWMSEATV